MSGTPEHDRATAGPYTLVIPPNGRATLYEADGAGVDHEVPYGVNQLDALIQFAGEVIRLHAMADERQREGSTASLSPPWRPISEAPRDGRWIVALATDSSVYRVSWGRNHNDNLAWCSVAGSFIEGYLTKWIEWPGACIGDDMAGVAEQSGAGASETSVRCGAPAANSGMD